MNAQVRAGSAALLRAGLLAAVLAVVAGILGMHVMTADHSAHGGHTAAAAQAVAGHGVTGHGVTGLGVSGHDAGYPAVGHSLEALAAHPAAYGETHGMSFAAADSCSSGCPGAEETGASCIPLGKTGSLAAVPPPATASASLEAAAGTRSAAGYSYVPSGPTPCELSISRT
ncbi:hypothetical protein FDW83_07095 [Pseudarthrobacter sp. NamE2]|uniref:hypothetical protein n=1 Tax=Pseudarthrobacter sp. NamE2 TaxID=2576838 RepID=UPI0010FEB0FA|nr:hypothetical protein [Pseudarthrobacter sp. NamE2]TLM84479.1 hypothetical protein FDW83_07095 [Pseudarthrobacter sp. NamE2]